MRFIKIFLASSIETFKFERYEIGDFIRILNNVLIRHDSYIELILCEHLSNSIAKERKQEEYNQQIRECDYVYILCGNVIGMYTKEEFQVAATQFQKTGTPKIEVYFYHTFKQGTLDQSVIGFIKYLKRNKYTCHKVEHLDIMKLRLLMEIVNLCNIKELLRLEKDKLILEEYIILSLENIRKD